MNRRPWPDRYVDQHWPHPELIAQLETTLNDAHDESPLQTLLATHPCILLPMLPSASDIWLFDRPKFGAELVPDILLCHRNSIGFNWMLVELESPCASIQTKDGQPAAKLNHALAQIRDWRIWLRANIAYAQNQLGFRDISAECPAWIIIGRRSSLQPKHALKYRELSSTNTNTMTYDRVLESAKAHCTAGG